MLECTPVHTWQRILVLHLHLEGYKNHKESMATFYKAFFTTVSEIQTSLSGKFK